MNMRMTKYRGVASGAVAAAGFGGLQWLGRTAGAKEASGRLTYQAMSSSSTP
jgi:hypothetical protein